MAACGIYNGEVASPIFNENSVINVLEITDFFITLLVD